MPSVSGHRGRSSLTHLSSRPREVVRRTRTAAEDVNAKHGRWTTTRGRRSLVRGRAHTPRAEVSSAVDRCPYAVVRRPPAVVSCPCVRLSVTYAQLSVVCAWFCVICARLSKALFPSRRRLVCAARGRRRGYERGSARRIDASYGSPVSERLCK